MAASTPSAINAAKVYDVLDTDAGVRRSITIQAPWHPADTNNDQALSIDDVWAFLAAFRSGDIAADFTGDGKLDINDLIAFQTSFAIGF